jgi:prepilin-type N-terminal cleavage/methylation domain-containing protein
MFGRRRTVWPPLARAFSLVELLLVMALAAILAALVLSGIVRAKAQANSAACKSHLRQMGLALKMYVDEHQDRYPYGVGPITEADAGNFNPADYNLFWFARLTPYYPLQWTNATYHCPGYQGPIIGIFNDGTNKCGPRGSYGYNTRGVRGSYNRYADPASGLRVNYGLGPKVHAIPLPAVAEAAVKVPSEMLAIG